jgi:DNA-binding NtrC family response regulator
MDQGPVLISWVAVKNDPYERKITGGPYQPDRNGDLVRGPTLTFLCDETSPYSTSVRDVVLLRREEEGEGGEKERRATQDLVDAIRECRPEVAVQVERWHGDDPTEHVAIFDFLRTLIRKVRRRYSGRELVVHVSPGTPSMQTIWVLMGETGFIEEPFSLVKSYRKRERRGRPAVVPVELGIETFYKVYKTARPRQVASEEQGVVWDPRDFRTDAMRRLFTEARRFAQIKVPVLLLGERGTGKTTLARWIRGNSPYRKESIDAGWPAVACGQYTSETLRSELFGYVKGSFTGAARDTDGLLAKADRDTLFLDEIGDLSSENQRRIIKAVEENTYYRIGDTEPKRSDFRLLTATNLEMDELRRRLHPDFLDRLSHLTLRLPPLREIVDELDWLWRSAYQAATARAGITKRQAQFASSHHQHIVDRLKRHPLPGNMRDLFRVAYRVLAARSDAHDPLSPQDAVAYGLEALNNFGVAESGTSMARAVARAFADAEPLDSVVHEAGVLPTEAIERDLREFIANEIRRISKETGQPIENLCDRTDRTLRTWSKRAPGAQLPRDGKNDPKPATRSQSAKRRRGAKS